MKTIIYVFLFTSSLLFSQQRITKNLGDFNKVKVFSGLRVKLIKSESPSIEINGRQSENVIVKNVNGLLKLSVTFPNAFEVDKTFIKLYFTKDLQLIDTNEGSKITSDNAIEQDYLEVKTQEGAVIQLRLKVKNLKVKSISGGVISLSGDTTNQTVTVNTGGVYEGFDLHSDQANVIAATGGEIEIMAVELLEAKAKFKGTVYYKIKAQKVIKKESFGGIICDYEKRNKYYNDY